MGRRKKKVEAETRLKLTQMQKAETQETPTRRFASFRQRSSPQTSISNLPTVQPTPQIPTSTLQPSPQMTQVADEPPQASEENILQQQMEARWRLFEVELAKKMEAQ
jgi:hypothetical protein